MPKNLEIEHLRALAILLTLIAHVGFISPPDSTTYSYIVNNLFQFWGGVDLFFCISGYVISKILIGKVDNTKKENRYNFIKAFYIKRAFRILPLSMFWIFFVVWASVFFNKSGVFGISEKTFQHALAALLFTENIYLTYHIAPQLSVYWSLSLEEQFYLFFPLFLILVNPEKRFNLLLVLILLQFLLPRPADQSKILSMIRFDAIMWGVVIYLFNEKNQSHKFIDSKKIFIVIALLGLLYF